MILNKAAQDAIKAGDEDALIAALEESGYTSGAARYLAGKLLGSVEDDRTVL